MYLPNYDKYVTIMRVYLNKNDLSQMIVKHQER